jgi:hypothetical protein
MSDEITKTGDALAKGSLADQVKAAEARRTADMAAHEARSRGGTPTEHSTGNEAPIERYNPVALAKRPAVEARAAEMRSAHIQRAPTPDGVLKMHYRCLSCGWSATLEFDPADPVDAKVLEEVGGELANYTGPCPAEGCGYHTLVPHDAVFAETFDDRKEAELRAQAGVMTDAVVDKLIERGGDVLMGNAAKAAAMHGEGKDVDEDEEPAGELPSDAT